MRISDWSSDVCSSDLGDAAFSALRQRHIGNVDRRADIEAGQRNHDFFRNVRRVDDQVEVVTDDVEHAAALDAGRGVFIDETDRDVDVDGRMLADAQEIRVKRAIAHRVELHVRSEEHTSELQSLMRSSYAVFCLKTTKNKTNQY